MNNNRNSDPVARFREWYAEAVDSEPSDPEAMALATVGPDGMPSVRMVLLKDVDDAGFVFFTNLESHKGRDLAANPVAALCFHWKSLRRAVRVEGTVSPVADGEADEYFDSRARGSRIGAWASAQSRPMAGAHELEKQVARFTAKYGLGAIPRPAHWSGFRLDPLRIEFWRERPFRLHERILYYRTDRDGDGEDGEDGERPAWRTERLFP